MYPLWEIPPYHFLIHFVLLIVTKIITTHSLYWYCILTNTCTIPSWTIVHTLYAIYLLWYLKCYGTYTHIHTCTGTHRHRHTCTHARTYTHAYTHTHTHTHMRAHTCTDTYTDIHVHRQSDTCTHTQTHTHVLI